MIDFIVETIIEGKKTQSSVKANTFSEAEILVKTPAIQQGEQVTDVQYGDINRSGVSVIKSVIGDFNIERRIYPSRNLI